MLDRNPTSHKKYLDSLQKDTILYDQKGPIYVLTCILKKLCVVKARHQAKNGATDVKTEVSNSIVLHFPSSLIFKTAYTQQTDWQDPDWQAAIISR